MLQAAGKLGLVVDPKKPGGDVSFSSVPDEKLAAYKALKLRQPILKGADLELFKKLQEIFENDIPASLSGRRMAAQSGPAGDI